MKPTRVLIVNHESLLTGGVGSLLTQEQDLNVLSTKVENGSILIAVITDFEPEVVIIDESRIILNATELLTLLGPMPYIRVIVMNNHNSNINIYDKKKVSGARVNELISLIKDRH